MYKPLKELRREIIIGCHEPIDEECKMSKISECGDGLDVSKPLKDELNREREIKFWLSVLKRVGLTSQMIEVYDEPILKYLYEIDVDLQDKKPYNFTLRFYFYPNEFFTNEVLTKTYEFKIELDQNDPFVFEAPETVCSKGCKINWKKGKNVTKKSNVLDSNEDRQLSFFNFFDTNDFENKTRDRLTCDEEAELAIDYEIGYTFKEKVIPRAILYYMGEINDDDDDEEEQSDFDDDNEQDDDYEINLAESKRNQNDMNQCTGVSRCDNRKSKNLNKN
ncbi:unnamed protein product [Brachionus calyciflorus]|uniref:Uncharacterized protein n=2 Tax=Brachionus calyciflorus TaxID=104777 RepID=A0A814FQL7_9BILA|nr:unnamed protein product [Brachionus calyciflorus]